MSVAQCLAKHPESDATCYMPAERAHNYHLAHPGLNWPNADYVAPPKPIKKAKFASDANKIKDGIKRATTGVPAEAMEAWSKDDWVRQAKATLLGFCQSRTLPFTTPEDVWPLLDAPREMRAFTVPVQAALKAGWIVEVGAKRLSDVYRTRDGREFAMNKLVPIYQSTLVGPQEVQASTLSD